MGESVFLHCQSENIEEENCSCLSIIIGPVYWTNLYILYATKITLSCVFEPRVVRFPIGLNIPKQIYYSDYTYERTKNIATMYLAYAKRVRANCSNTRIYRIIAYLNLFRMFAVGEHLRYSHCPVEYEIKRPTTRTHRLTCAINQLFERGFVG